MVNSIVIAIIVFASVLATPKIVKLKESWQTMLVTAIVAAILVAIWETVNLL